MLFTWSICPDGACCLYSSIRALDGGRVASLLDGSSADMSPLSAAFENFPASSLMCVASSPVADSAALFNFDAIEVSTCFAFAGSVFSRSFNLLIISAIFDIEVLSVADELSKFAVPLRNESEDVDWIVDAWIDEIDMLVDSASASTCRPAATIANSSLARVPDRQGISAVADRLDPPRLSLMVT